MRPASKDHTALHARARVVRGVRAHLEGDGFTEVHPPCLVPCPTMDTHIHGLAVEGGGFLHASPEFAMKRLLAAGWRKIYALGPVWRREAAGPLHTPEFTMLEWYRAGADYRVLMDDCRALVAATLPAPRPWRTLTVAQAFARHAGIDLAAHLDDLAAFRAAAGAAGVRVVGGDDWGDVFDAVMAEQVEPALRDGCVLLHDYPAALGALARLKPDDPRWAERVELYIDGVEVANGFSELTDAAEQRARFTRDAAAKRARYGFAYDPDPAFLAALEAGMPDSAGMALGVDRLAMIAAGARDVRGVQWGAGMV
jgi:elongation factor P--(R)-beta-lysine ligase